MTVPDALTPPEIGRFTCSHNGCNVRLPNSYQGQEIPPGWTVAHVEEHGTNHIKDYYIYLCPKHTIASAERQTRLF